MFNLHSESELRTTTTRNEPVRTKHGTNKCLEEWRSSAQTAQTDQTKHHTHEDTTARYHMLSSLENILQPLHHVYKAVTC
jgi:hypothetical protein